MLEMLISIAALLFLILMSCIAFFVFVTLTLFALSIAMVAYIGNVDCR